VVAALRLDGGVPADRVTFRLLGPVGLWLGEQPLGPATAQQRSVLALLLLDLDTVVPVPKISAALWSTAPPASAHNAVQGYVARLRRLLSEVCPAARLIRTGAGYRLSADRRDVDLYQFRDLVTAAREARPDEADDLLGAALALWHGPALADVAGDWLPTAMRPVLEEERLAAVETRLAGDLGRGRGEQSIAALSALVAEHPLRERPVALLMTALHQSGRTAEALGLFRDTRRRLVGELGIEPGEELAGLHQRILGGRAQAAADPAPAPAVPRQLPADLPDLVGRTAELSFLDELPAAPGIAVVCGWPGSGKTSLVVHWAHRVRERFPDGQMFVDMRGFHPGPRRSVAEALPLLLVALGVPADQVPIEADAQVALYRSVLSGRRVLLVLDNVAHADQVRPLVPGGLGCLVVVTSRDRLSGLVARDGARRLTLDVLPAADAVALLAAAAGAPGADRIAADRDAARELAELCGRLPLALRIAGARLADRAHLGVRRQVEELTARGRMSQLRVEEDDGATVRTAFDLSYQALPARAGRLFRLLGLVPAPAGLAVAAAAALAGLPEDDIDALADALARLHLVRVTAAGRLVAHDLLLEYAAGLAAEQDTPAERDAAVDRVLHFYLHTADRANAALNGSPRLWLLREPAPPGVPVLELDDQERTRQWLDAEWPNLVAALEHAAASGRNRLAWQLAHALRDVMRLQAHPAQWRSIARLGLAAARHDGDPRGESVMRQTLGLLRWRTGDLRGARAEYEAAVVLARGAGWPAGISAAGCNVGITLAQLGRPRAAIALFEQSLSIDRELGDRRAEAGSLTNLAAAFEEVGDLATAARYGELAMPLLRETGQHLGAAVAGDNLAMVRRELGRLDQARAASEESLRICRTIGARHEEAAALTTLGRVHADAGRYAQAEEVLCAGLDIVQRLSDSRLEVFAHTALAETHLRQGRPAEVAERLELTLAIVEQTGNRRAEVEALLLYADLLATRKEFPAALDHATRAAEVARAGGYALLTGQAYSRLAIARLGLADPAGCLIDGRRALRIQRRAGQRLAYARTLVTVGLAHEGLGERSRARAQWRAAHAVFEEAGTPEREQTAALLG
jgi:DNA-binding SARP family transcriptional activator/tetratricopeptide (TPR) repeat protein